VVYLRYKRNPNLKEPPNMTTETLATRWEPKRLRFWQKTQFELEATEFCKQLDNVTFTGLVLTPYGYIGQCLINDLVAELGEEEATYSIGFLKCNNCGGVIAEWGGSWSCDCGNAGDDENID
jgi:hypothetical protein